MSENFFPKSQKGEIQKDNEKSHQAILQKFSEKFNAVFDKADENILNLIDGIDKLIDEEQSVNQMQELDQNDQENDSIQGEKTYHKLPQIYESSTPDSTVQNLTLGELTKKKQDMMKKLREVNRLLLQKKFHPIQPLRQLKQIRSPKNRKQQPDEVPLSTNLNPFKTQPVSQNANRTLELMEQLNREKIKRHEEMVNRMQKRQQEELKKIRELEERRIKIELKKCQVSSKMKQNLSQSEKKAFPKKVF